MNKDRSAQYLQRANDLLAKIPAFLKNPVLDLEKFSAAAGAPHPTRAKLALTSLLSIVAVSKTSAEELAGFIRFTEETTDFFEWYSATVKDFKFSATLWSLLRQSDTAASGTFMGNSTTFMLSLRAVVATPPIFQIENRLLHLLDESDIGTDLEVGRIANLPYDLMYVELGATHDLDLSVINAQTGLHRLEGFYVFKCQQSPNPRMSETLNFVFCGEPKAHILDDATQTLTLSASEEGLSKGLAQSIDESVSMLPSPSFPMNLETLTPNLRDLYLKCMQMAAKCILYLNHGHFEKVQSREFTEHEKALKAITNPSKREKAERRGYGKTDRIIIRPREDLSASPGAGGKGSVAAHTRRGHFRQQRHGEKLALVKVLWIAPTFVGQGKDHEGAHPKDYQVKS